MSYRVVIGGTVVEMDSPEEVYSLLSQSVPEGTAKTLIGPQSNADWNVPHARQFLNDFPKESLQLKLIRAVYRSSEPRIGMFDLVRDLKLAGPHELGGILSGLAKNAKKLGHRSPIAIERMRDPKGQRTYTYSLADEFIYALVEMDKEQIIQTEQAADELPALREFISKRRSALAGFMNQGASLRLDDDVLKVAPRDDIYVRYLSDNRSTIAELASEFFHRPIQVEVIPNGRLLSLGDKQPIKRVSKTEPVNETKK